MKKHLFRLAVLMIVVALLVCAGYVREASARKPLSMGGSNPGGTAFIVGTAFASIVNAHVDYVTLTHEVTAGGRDNITFAQSGEIDFGYGFSGFLYEAYRGIGDYEGNPHGQLRAFMPWWDYPVQIVVLADSGIYSISDLRDRRIGVNVMGSGAFKTSMQVFSTLGMEMGVDYQAFHLAFQESIDALSMRRIDAQVFTVGAPMPALLELGMTHDFRVLPFTYEEMRKISDRFPYYSPGVMLAGTYPNIQEDVPTLMAFTIVWANADLPEQTAYDILRAIWENRADLEAAHPVTRDIGPDLVQRGLLGVATLHPGAERFYRSIGVIE